MSKEAVIEHNTFVLTKSKSMNTIHRLTPIENPKALLLKIAYFMSRKQFGKVIAPLKYIYSRSIPALMTSMKVYKSENKLSLPKETRLFIRYYTSHLNDCPFCSNSVEFLTQKENLELQQWKEFMNFRNSNKFSNKEKSLLAYLEEVNFTKNATDETFNDLKKYYSEKEIVEITWLNATENYYNLMAKPLGLTSDELKYQ
jgi:alkylhydroperoxidase family enzyme